MSSLAALLSHTPLFVWAILVFLVWQGERSSRRRRRSVWTMALVPLAFAATDLFALSRSGIDATSMLAWSIVAVVAFPLGRATGPRRLSAFSMVEPVVWAPGRAPLVRNLSVFGAHYALSAIRATHPEAKAGLALAAAALSGATIGYVAGWTLTLLRGDRTAGPQARVAAAP